MGIMVDGRTFNDGPFPPPKGDSNIEISVNKVLNVFGKQPPIKRNGNDYLPVGSSCIGVFDAGNTLIEKNDVSTNGASLANGYDPFIGISVQDPERKVVISENTISNMWFGIFGMLTPHIKAENNTVTNCFFGITASNQMLPDFKAAKNSPLQVENVMPLMKEKLKVRNGNKIGFSVESWEFNENTVTSCAFGFFVIVGDLPSKKEKDEPKFRAMGNTVEQNDSGFLIIDNGSLKPEINENIIQENVDFSIYYVTSSDIGKRDDADDPEVDGRFNFWGSEDPPPVSSDRVGTELNAVTPNVKYAPWVGAEPGTTPMTYFVDDTGSIQDAIDQAEPGEIIRILGGEYEGNVNTAGKGGITLYPGDSPACVTFTGTFDVTEQDILVIDIEGNSVCEEYTRLSVLGHVNLNGIELDIRLGFIPQLEDEFDIVVSNNPITGQFAQQDEIVVEYQDQEVRVTFSIAYLNDRGDNKVVLTVTGIDSTALPIGNLALFVAMGLMVLFFVITGLKQRTSRA